MRPEDRALIAPGTRYRVLHWTKSKMYTRPSWIRSATIALRRRCSARIQGPLRHAFASCYPYSCRDRAETLLQSISQTERYLSFRNGVIGMAVQGVSAGEAQTMRGAF